MTHKMPAPPYTELMCLSPFTFLEGASHADELMLTAKILGYQSLAITDRNSLAGIVRAHTAAKEHGIKLIVGVRIDLRDDLSFLVYPTDRQAYARLTTLLTTGNRRAEKGDCILYLKDLAAASTGQCMILLPEGAAGPVPSPATLNQISQKLDCPLMVGATMLYEGQDKRRLAALDQAAKAAGLRLVALGDVRFHAASRARLHDVMTCIRTHQTLKEAGYTLQPGRERYLKSADEMARLFEGYGDALTASTDLAAACSFSLEELRYNYPNEPVPDGETPQSQLEKLAWDGARARFPGDIPPRVEAAIRHELSLIKQLNYAPYFLTVHDIVSFARARGILCQGRGSAANSVVCFVTGITAVNPMEVDLLFERFISAERNEPPDIDVDFEHARREEVIQYIYARYGRHRAGLAATVIRYRPRSAVREVGKVMGLAEDTVSAMASTIWGSFGRRVEEDHVNEAGIDIGDPLIAETLSLTEELLGFPRHLSQHVGGFVLTETPLTEVVPIQNAAMADRTIVEWDKDDLDALGILKIDVLALGMLTALKGCFDLLDQHYGQQLSLATLPREDPVTYTMLCRADSVGVFQVESRAQMNMLPRLRPRTFYDLVIQVAIVRPGPIQGDMVHPYLRRRSGEEMVSFPAPAPEYGPPDELKQVLGKTLGVPLFQEQAMKIAIVAAGFEPGEADKLRRAMATFRHTGQVGNFHGRFVEGMAARGYERQFAERCFSQIEGFGEYGFPESHAASFGLLVYASAWMKCHFPAVFCCALLNAQPMGFYAPAQLVRDAVEHGVEMRPPDINHSDWDSILEPAPHNRHRFAVRLGLRQVKGLREEEMRHLVAMREETGEAYRDIADLQRRTGLSPECLEGVVEADACRSIGLSRRQALWAVKGLQKGGDLPLFQAGKADGTGADPAVNLPEMALSEEVVDDYQTLRLSLKAHPLSFLRGRLMTLGVSTTAEIRNMRDGQRVRAAGLVLVRQRPGSAKGVCFITLEDEKGVANAVVWPDTFKAYRKEVMGSRLIIIDGKIQRSGDIIHVVSNQLVNASHLLLSLSNPSREPTASDPIPVSLPSRHPRNVRNIVPKSRDFH